ncbi:serine/threonine protein kinase [Patescibacteria group bacterium]|nr:serine/threonine protein kinase [Patescibacteria group bacterium]
MEKTVGQKGQDHFVTGGVAPGSSKISGVDHFMTGGALPTGQMIPKGTILCGKYEILRLLGEGSFSSVYEAVSGEKLTRLVWAIKVFNQGDPAQIKAEYDIQKAINPNGCPELAYAVCIDEDPEHGPCILMNYVHGLSLEEVVAQDLHFKWSDEWERLIYDVFFGLELIHKRKALHRDLKPRHIMFREAGPPRNHLFTILDFGIAQEMRAQFATQVQAGAGTPFFMAPEVLRGDRVSISSDIYSLAATFYYLFVGEPPIGIIGPDDFLRSRDRFKVVFDVKELAALICRNLARVPSKRMQTVVEFREALLSCMTHMSQTQKNFEGYATTLKSRPNELASDGELAFRFECAQELSGNDAYKHLVQQDPELQAIVDYVLSEKEFTTRSSTHTDFEKRKRKILMEECDPENPVPWSLRMGNAMDIVRRPLFKTVTGKQRKILLRMFHAQWSPDLTEDIERMTAEEIDASEEPFELTEELADELTGVLSGMCSDTLPVASDKLGDDQKESGFARALKRTYRFSREEEVALLKRKPKLSNAQTALPEISEVLERDLLKRESSTEQTDDRPVYVPSQEDEFDSEQKITPDIFSPDNPLSTKEKVRAYSEAKIVEITPRPKKKEIVESKFSLRTVLFICGIQFLILMGALVIKSPEMVIIGVLMGVPLSLVADFAKGSLKHTPKPKFIYFTTYTYTAIYIEFMGVFFAIVWIIVKILTS